MTRQPSRLQPELLRAILRLCRNSSNAPVNQPLRLYSPHAVVIATVMGSLIAGAVLVALNYQALQRRDLARRTLIIGLVLQFAMIGAAMMAPSGPVTGMVMLGSQIALAFGGAQFLQGKTIDYHLAHGAMLHSAFRALGIGFLVGIAFAFVFVAVVLTSGWTPPQ